MAGRKLSTSKFKGIINDAVHLATLGKEPADIEKVLRILMVKAGELHYRLNISKAKRAKAEEQNV